MRAIDHLTLGLVNQKLGLTNGDGLKISDIIKPSFDAILQLRKGFQDNGLSKICSNGLRRCIYLESCRQTAEQNYRHVALFPEAVP